MKSLGAYPILRAMRNPVAAQTLIAIETYNATTIDRLSNHYAHILAEKLGISQTASSDAHVLDAVGLGVTEFDRHTARNLAWALQNSNVRQQIQDEWNTVHILGSWAARYVGSAFTRLANATGQGAY